MTVTADGKLVLDFDGSSAARGIASLDGAVNRSVLELGKGSQGLAGFQGNIEKVATSASGVASALGGMGGAAGPALGAISNLAAAVMAGGPLLAGLALVGVAAAGVASHFSDLAESEREAHEEAVKLGRELGVQLADQLRNVQEATQDAQKALEDYGMAGVDVAAKDALGGYTDLLDRQDAVSREAAAMTEELTLKTDELALATKLLAGEKREFMLLSSEEKTQVVEISRNNQREIDQIKERRGELQTEISVIEQSIPLAKQQLDTRREIARRTHEDTAAAEAEREAIRRRTEAKRAAEKAARDALKAAQDEAREREKLAKIETDIARAIRDARATSRDTRVGEEAATARELAEIEWAEFASLQERKRSMRERMASEAASAEVAAQKQAINDVARAREAALKQQQDDAQQSLEYMTGVATATSDMLLDVIESYAAGEEIRLVQVGAAFLRSEGTKIVGIGIRSLAEAAASAATPGGQGVALQQAGVGASLIALGTSMGGAGAALTGLDRGGMLNDFGVIPGRGGSDVGGIGGGGASTSGVRGGQFDSGPGAGSGPVVYNVTFSGSTMVGNPNESVSYVGQMAHEARYEQFSEA